MLTGIVVSTTEDSRARSIRPVSWHRDVDPLEYRLVESSGHLSGMGVALDKIYAEERGLTTTRKSNGASVNNKAFELVPTTRNEAFLLVKF